MNILLIDTQQQVLAILKSAFNENDDITHVTNLSILQELLQKKRFDVVITPSLLGKINGDSLLKTLAKNHPNMVRVQIINHELYSKNYAHFNFNLPLNIADIKSKLTQCQTHSKAITKSLIVKAVAGIKTLPSPPKVYMQLNSVLKEKNTDSQKIAEIILQDPGLTAKVLHLANSTFMSNGKSITSINNAITKMGVDTLSCIVMTAELFTYAPDIPGFSLVDQQLHSFATAKLAASMVKPELKQQAMIAGLLHAIGKVVLYEIKPDLTEKFFKLRHPKEDNKRLEQKVFGTDYCHVGGYLLHTWSFSYALIEAIILQGSPEKLLKPPFGIAQAVYLANILLKERKPDPAFIEYFKMEGVMEKLEERANKLRSI